MASAATDTRAIPSLPDWSRRNAAANPRDRTVVLGVGRLFEQAFNQGAPLGGNLSRFQGGSARTHFNSYRPTNNTDSEEPLEGATASDSAMDDAAEGSRSEEPTAQEIADREAFLAEGLAAAVAGDYTQQDVPSDIAKIHEGAVWIVRRAWKRGLHPTLLNRCEAVNQMIANTNHAAQPPREPGMYGFPGEQVMNLINFMYGNCEVWHTERTRATQPSDERKGAFTNIAFAILSVRSIIQPLGLSWKLFVTPEAVELLTAIIDSDNGLLEQSIRDALLKYLEADRPMPTYSQRQVMENAGTAMTSFFEGVRNRNPTQALQQLQSVTAVNVQMAETNTQLALKSHDHTLDTRPLADFVNLLSGNAHSVAEVEAKIVSYAWFLNRTGFQPMARAIADLDAVQACQPSDEIKAYSEIKLLEYHSPLDAERTAAQEASEPLEDAPEGPLFVPPEPPAQEDRLPTAIEVAHRPSAVSGSRARQSIPSTRSQGGFRTSGVRAPAFRGNVTPLGIVYNIQKISFGYRAIVNVGTANDPVYQTMPGAESGRGTAEDLHARYQASPPQQLRERRKGHVEQLKAIFEVPQRTLNATRAPITKFLVKWRQDANFSNEEEWVSRSDLIPIYGKRDTESARQQLLEDLRNNLEWLARCQADNVHPETGQTLTDRDWQDTPWLCPPRSTPGRDSRHRTERRADPDLEPSTAQIGSTQFATPRR